MVKKLTCIRGHDTSYPEARCSDGTCRECKRLHHKKYMSTEKGVLSRRGKLKRYRATEKGKFFGYMQKLRKRMRQKRTRIIELERILNEAQD